MTVWDYTKGYIKGMAEKGKTIPRHARALLMLGGVLAMLLIAFWFRWGMYGLLKLLGGMVVAVVVLIVPMFFMEKSWRQAVMVFGGVAAALLLIWFSYYFPPPPVRAAQPLPSVQQITKGVTDSVTNKVSPPVRSGAELDAKTHEGLPDQVKEDVPPTAVVVHPVITSVDPRCEALGYGASEMRGNQLHCAGPRFFVVCPGGCSHSPPSPSPAPPVWLSAEEEGRIVQRRVEERTFFKKDKGGP